MREGYPVDPGALADPTVLADLCAGDFGRPLYERMGYLPICRVTLWARGRRAVG